jgi:NTP pyrophosphatase (non-canonical NTP hydrolase)
MKDLTERSYLAIKARGLITPKTTKIEFLEKMREELNESYQEILHDGDYIEEVTDLATVCIMQLRHLGCDFETEFLKVVEKNEARANIRKVL